jgi:molecular chaperone IbpA
MNLQTKGDYIGYLNRNSKTIQDYMLGFAMDDMFKRLPSNLGSFPPHDLEKKDTMYKLTLAVAGYSKENINIELKDNLLTIEGDREENEREDLIVTGIAARKFRKSFSLSDTMEVRDADLKDGLLTITFEEVTPEEEKPKVIKIK